MMEARIEDHCMDHTDDGVDGDERRFGIIGGNRMLVAEGTSRTVGRGEGMVGPVDHPDCPHDGVSSPQGVTVAPHTITQTHTQAETLSQILQICIKTLCHMQTQK